MSSWRSFLESDCERSSNCNEVQSVVTPSHRAGPRSASTLVTTLVGTLSANSITTGASPSFPLTALETRAFSRSKS